MGVRLSNFRQPEQQLERGQTTLVGFLGKASPKASPSGSGEQSLGHETGSLAAAAAAAAVPAHLSSSEASSSSATSPASPEFQLPPSACSAPSSRIAASTLLEGPWWHNVDETVLDELPEDVRAQIRREVATLRDHNHATASAKAPARELSVRTAIALPSRKRPAEALQYPSQCPSVEEEPPEVGAGGGAGGGIASSEVSEAVLLELPPDLRTEVRRQMELELRTRKRGPSSRGPTAQLTAPQGPRRGIEKFLQHSPPPSCQ